MASGFEQPNRGIRDLRFRVALAKRIVYFQIKQRKKSMNGQRGMDTDNVSPKDKNAIAMKAFFRIAELWRLSAPQQLILLGEPSRATLYNWKGGIVRNVPADTIRRISYILGIYRGLQVLYQESRMADAWIKKSNTSFGGQSALERMLAGDMTDLAAVRRHIDSVRGGWA